MKSNTKPSNYKISTIDNRPSYYKEKVIKNIVRLDVDSRHYIFYTNKGRIRLRTDTWRKPIKL